MTKRFTTEERLQLLEQQVTALRQVNRVPMRKMLCRLKTQITAATYATATNTFTLGKGTGRPVAANASDELVEIGDGDIDIWSFVTEASEDPASKDLIVWVGQSHLDGRYYQVNEACNPPDVT
ncbi:MAG: hypothetical protein ACPHCN_13395 [Mycobacterium sp.]